MPGSDPQETQPARARLHPLGVLGFGLLLVGLLGSIWLGDWRWAATGAVALVLLQGAGAIIDQRRKP